MALCCIDKHDRFVLSLLFCESDINAVSLHCLCPLHCTGQYDKTGLNKLNSDKFCDSIQSICRGMGMATVTQSVTPSQHKYCIQGVILLELNKTEEAKKRFEQSLSIMPNFQMAKANLDYLSKTGTKGN